VLLEQLTARRFRNLGDVSLYWSDGFNVIWGRNAQGKTNLLEAVYLLGHLKSFRGSRVAELVQEGSEAARINGCVTAGGVQHQLEVTIEERGLTPRLDGKAVSRLSQFLGTVRPVLFTADELGLLKGSPAGRRSLIDRAVLQADPSYLDRVQTFQRVLRQRNQLLKERAPATQLAPWDEALIENGAQLRHDRGLYLGRLQPLLRQVGAEIAGGEEIDLHYHQGGHDLSDCRARLRRDIERLHGREQLLGQTLAGPHRDDPEPLVGGRPLKLFGSQGQIRSFLLAFKAAQLLDLEALLGEPPLLLLDDLASELDAERQASFFAFLRRRRGQVLITTTHPATLGPAVCPEARYFRVEQGKIEEYQDV